MQWRFHSRARGESAENRCSDEHLCKTPGPEDLANENSVESQEAEQSHGGGAVHREGLGWTGRACSTLGGRGRTSRLNRSRQSGKVPISD